MNSPTTMRLADGSHIELTAIETQTIPITAVAEALGNTTRGNGHWVGYDNANHAVNCIRAYSAASSVRHKLTIPGIMKAGVRSPIDQLFHLTCALACLHHDDGEAIVPDITRPLAHVPELRAAVEVVKGYEKRARDAILAQHDVPTDQAAWGISKIIDRWVIARECAYISGREPLPAPLRHSPWSTAAYLQLHAALMDDVAVVRRRLAAA